MKLDDDGFGCFNSSAKMFLLTHEFPFFVHLYFSRPPSTLSTLLRFKKGLPVAEDYL